VKSPDVACIEGQDPVNTDTRPGSSIPAGNCHVDLAVIGGEQAPKGGRCSVTHHRTIATRQHGRHLTREWRQNRMAYEVDAFMHTMKTPARHAMRDAAAVEPRRGELRARDDAVLSGCDLTDAPVSPQSGMHYVTIAANLAGVVTFCIAYMQNVTTPIRTRSIVTFCIARRSHTRISP